MLRAKSTFAKLKGLCLLREVAFLKTCGASRPSTTSHNLRAWNTPISHKGQSAHDGPRTAESHLTRKKFYSITRGGGTSLGQWLLHFSAPSHLLLINHPILSKVLLKSNMLRKIELAGSSRQFKEILHKLHPTGHMPQTMRYIHCQSPD